MTRPLPFTSPGANPLALYLRGERAAVADIEEDLRDAMADAQRRINKLETKAGIGSVVRRAQLALVRRELRATQETLWRSIGKRIRSAGTRIADAAAEAERVLQDMLFNQSSGRQTPEALVEAQRGYARRTVENYLARGQNGIGLSERVYRSKALSSQWVDRAINRSLLQGDGWQELAARVRPLINPDVKGGVSFAAKRLARTELNNAFHTVQKESADINPFVTKLDWNLSRSHPKKDVCDALAADGPYLPGALPLKPHPQCLCYMTNVMMDEDEFLDLVSSDEFLDGVVDDYEEAAKELRPAAGGEVIQLRPKNPTPPPSQPKTGREALQAIPRKMWDSDLDFESERLLFQSYKGFAYINFNEYLRIARDNNLYKQEIQTMDRILDSSRLKEDAVFWRGVKNPRGVLGDLVERDLTGLEWQEDAYFSMSADKRVADDFAIRKEGPGMRMRIVARKGAPVLQLSKWAEEGQETRVYEAEGLGGRGWRLRVVADHGTDEDGLRNVDVEVISHARNGKNPWS